MTSPDTERERRRLAEVYAGAADAELTDLAQEGASLAGVARTAWRQERNRGGIRDPVRESSQPPHGVESPSVVTVRQFLIVQEAPMAKCTLDSAGIERFLADENVISMNWPWSNALGGVKLPVRTTDAAIVSDLLYQKLSAAAEQTQSRTKPLKNNVLQLLTLDWQMLIVNREPNFQLLLKFMERMKLPRSLSIFFCSWKIA